MKKNLTIFCFIFLTYCGGPTKQPPPPTPGPTPSPRPTSDISPERRAWINFFAQRPPSPNTCPNKAVQVPGTDCFFVLPSLANGKSYLGHYKPKNLEGNTLTLGQGRWTCVNSKWQERYVHCVSCFARSTYQETLSKCQADLRRDISRTTRRP